jgi:hypothetical protein
MNDGANVFYEESGKGEPLQVIHGHSFYHYEQDLQFYKFAKKYPIRTKIKVYGCSLSDRNFHEEFCSLY